MSIQSNPVEGRYDIFHFEDVNNESMIFQGDDDMHDNNNSPTSNVVDNDSNYLRDCLHGDGAVISRD